MQFLWAIKTGDIRFCLLLSLESLEKPKRLQLGHVIFNDFDNLQISGYVQKSIGLNLSNFELIPLHITGYCDVWIFSMYLYFRDI